LPDEPSEKYLSMGLDDPNQLEKAHKIRIYAHAICALGAFARGAQRQTRTDLP